MPEEQHDNYSIILHPNQQQVLLLQAANGWTLPRHSGTSPAEINAAMQAQLGWITTVLGCVYDRYKDEEREEQHRVYALENQQPGAALPGNGRWVSLAELAQLPLAVPEHRGVLEAWLAQVADGASRFAKQPWMRPGWFATAAAWIDASLALLGMARVAPVEQMAARPGGRCCVCRPPAANATLKLRQPCLPLSLG